VAPVGGGGGGESGKMSVYTHICKCKNNTCWTVPGIKGGGVKRAVEAVNLSMICLTHCKNLCKCYNVLPPSTIKKIML
jgi:hypothetical protein